MKSAYETRIRELLADQEVRDWLELMQGLKLAPKL